MATWSSRSNIACLGAVRVLIGVTCVTRPGTLPAGLGVDSVTISRVRWIDQMVGAREIGLGLGLLGTLRRGDPRPWLAAGAIADGIDAVVLGRATWAGDVRRPSGLLGAALGGWATAGAILAVRELSRRPAS